MTMNATIEITFSCECRHCGRWIAADHPVELESVQGNPGRRVACDECGTPNWALREADDGTQFEESHAQRDTWWIKDHSQVITFDDTTEVSPHA